MRFLSPRTLFLGALIAGPMFAAPQPAHTDEAKVPSYSLPEPLVMADGSPVRDAAAWRARRRPELLELFAREVYGRTPAGRPAAMRAEVTSVDRAALGGKATRKEITLWFTGKTDGPRMNLLLYVPNHVATPPPVFLGLNFFGNHTVHADPGIALAQPHTIYDTQRYRPVDPQPEKKPEQRGAHAERWPVETVIARGYATASAWCNDLAPDRVGGLTEGVPALFGTGGAEDRAGDAWGAVGVWAWGLSRALDYLETDAAVGAKRVALHDNETALPVDQHQLLALIAPRPLYVASAAGDQWADPRGEFLSALGAEPVYTLHGKTGLEVTTMPAVDAPVGGTLRYHIRTGKHDIIAYDWAQYLDFADRHLRP